MAEITAPPPPTTVTDIPDIVSNILCRLPVKSLLRFKSVSKPWCSLIDSPHFIKQHIQHSLSSTTNQILILRHKKPYFSSISCDSLENAVKLRHPLEKNNYRREVVGCCDGLIAFLLECEDDVVLWNPSTKEHVEVIPAPLRFPGDAHQWCEYNAFGLGYDSVTDDYKLVRNAQFYQSCRGDEFDSRVQVISLKTGYWRRIEDCPYYFKYREVGGVLASEAVHWIACKKPESDTEDLIVAFDFKTEKFKEVEQPGNLDNGKELYKIIKVLGGCLCLIVHYIDDEGEEQWDRSKASHVDVWVMKEYGVKGSWCKLFTVKNPENTEHLGFVIPVMYSKCGKKVLISLDNEKLVWFDLIGKKIEEVKIWGLPDSFNVYLCATSLVSPFPCPEDPEKMIEENTKSIQTAMNMFRRMFG